VGGSVEGDQVVAASWLDHPGDPTGSFRIRLYRRGTRREQA
jgi:hypothetical protein